jgi:hypothetical protein
MQRHCLIKLAEIDPLVLIKRDRNVAIEPRYLAHLVLLSKSP